MKPISSLACLAVLLALPAGAGQAKTCSPPYSPPTTCTCSLAELRPTQAAVGFDEVKRKRAKIAKLKKKPKKLEKYQAKHPEPVVIGPGNLLYITDHHHLGRALSEEGISSTACRIELNLSKLTSQEFWQEMKRKNLVYLRDENGKEIAPEALPAKIVDLKDDPFRSLAGQVREAGGFEKTTAPFTEFRWAEFFRKKIAKPATAAEKKTALEKALKLAKSADAKALPGFKD